MLHPYLWPPSHVPMRPRAAGPISEESPTIRSRSDPSLVLSVQCIIGRTLNPQNLKGTRIQERSQPSKHPSPHHPSLGRTAAHWSGEGFGCQRPKRRPLIFLAATSSTGWQRALRLADSTRLVVRASPTRSRSPPGSRGQRRGTAAFQVRLNTTRARAGGSLSLGRPGRGPGRRRTIGKLPKGGGNVPPRSSSSK